jgi:secretion/DNA translocation related TadE-like protein
LSPRSDDRGSAAVSVVGLVAMVMVLMLGLADLAAFLLARSKAQTAADAAALAAAAELLPGRGPGPETEAEKLAELNGASLVSCTCPPKAQSVVVYVSVPTRFAILRTIGAKQVIARARAEVDIPGPFNLPGVNTD